MQSINPVPPQAAESQVSRRDFLTLLWKSLLGASGLLGLAGLWRFLSFQPDPARPTRFDLGPAENYPAGSRRILPEAQAVVQQTGEDLQALSLVCPHLGCQVEITAQGFACPCHGSSFGLDGSLEHGPAAQPLRTLALEKTAEGGLVLDTSK